MLRHLVEDGGKDENNKLMSFHKYEYKLLGKHKKIWTKIERLKNTDLNALRVYDDRYVKTKIKRYGHNLYTSFRALNLPEDDMACESLLKLFLLILYLFMKRNVTCKYT